MKHVVILLFLLSSIMGHAQYNTSPNKIWGCREKSGVDFNFPTPQPVLTAMHIAATGDTFFCAPGSVADNEGHLLFYTNGYDVWNRNHQLMPHGHAVWQEPNYTTGAGSLFDNLVIVPAIGQAGIYFIFTIGGGGQHNLHCNVVNMGLNNGFGDLDSTHNLNNLTINTQTCSMLMEAVAGCNNNVWIYMKSVTGTYGDSYKSYELTASGLDTIPVESSLNPFIINGIQALFLTISPLRNKSLAGGRYSTISDFNPSTGIFSNRQVIDTAYTAFYYDGCFSPDGSKVYLRSQGGPNSSPSIYQFDLSAPNITASKTFLGKCNQGIIVGKVAMYYHHNFKALYIDNFISLKSAINEKLQITYVKGNSALYRTQMRTLNRRMSIEYDGNRNGNHFF